MRIKHFSGYGSVNAKIVERRLDTSTHKEGYILNTIKINVWGNHECGLERDDWYDISQWLLKKVAKLTVDTTDIKNVECHYIPDIDGQEAIQYVITYKTKW